MNTDPAGENSIVKDGLSGSARPLPREPGATPGEGAGTGTDPAPDAGHNSAARDDVEGLNKAVGPAEESDGQEKDGRALTTDISPSD